MKSEKVDSGEVDQLLGQLRDVSIKEGSRRWVSLILGFTLDMDKILNAASLASIGG